MDDIKEFPVYLPCIHGTYGVYGYIGEVEEYKDNKGYIDKETGRIYICSKKEPPVHLDVPILYVNDKEVVKKDCIIPEKNDVYDVKTILDLSTAAVMEKTDAGEELYNEEAIRDMNAATSMYVPIIRDKDDPLKKMIKQIIIDKNININRLRHKTNKKYIIPNLRQGLEGDTRMSFPVFNIWCELLGTDYVITIADNGSDFINPLDHPVTYTSNTGEIQYGDPNESDDPYMPDIDIED